tara:strand:+ start:26084 stop:26899 length:816 start_codon:yes stop_codon:yes gene_type:complete
VIDFIGDIHGYGDKLELLLQKLGYSVNGGAFQHPTRKVIFIGDLIDKGPSISKVLNIIFPMLERKSAQAILGNHEYNFLAYHTTSRGSPLRAQNERNRSQIINTLSQLNQSERDLLLRKIYEMPLFVEGKNFRAVHACWDYASIEYLKSASEENLLSLDLLIESSIEGSRCFKAVETILKGPEQNLNEENYFLDQYGIQRRTTRIHWWKSSGENNGCESPIFFGHYWLKGVPKINNPKAFCLDYSVANSGYLCCYRFDGEEVLSDDKIVYV